MVSSNDVQRLFIQAILSRRILSQKLAAKLLEKCVDAVKAADESLDVDYREDRAFWDEWVTKINEALNPLDLEFAHLFDESTAKDMYALVNRKGDEVAQLATEYTPNEIAYFKGILEQIMLAPHESFCVSSLAALREASHLKSHMTKTQAEVVLGSLVARGWLLKSKRGRYSLSTRTLLELQPYLRSTYPDGIIECTICMEIVTSGYACSVNACKTRLHAHCYNNYRRRNHACPTCKTAWEANSEKMGRVGEGAFRDGQDRSRKVRRASTAADSDADEDDDEDGAGEEDEDEDDPSQSQDQSQSQSQSQPEPTQTQRNGKAKVKKEAVKTEGKGKGKKKAVREESMDVDEEAEATPPPRTQKRKGRR